MDSQIGEDLATKPDLAQNALVAIVLVGTSFAMKNDPVWLYAAINIESAAGVVEINECSMSGLSDLPERLLHKMVAIADRGSEDVSGEAVRMDADQHGVVTFIYLSLDEREMALSAVDFAFVCNGAEISIGSGEKAFGDSEDVALILKPVAN